MEFRTRSLDNEGDGGDASQESEVFDQLINQAKKQLAKDPQKRVNLAKNLYENYGIDPQITALFVPNLENDIQDLQEGKENAPTNQTNPEPANTNVPQNQNQVQTMPEPVDITSQDVIDVVESFQDYLGNEATLEETKEFIEDNSDIVQREIDMRL